MNLDHVRTFQAVARHGSFSAAAKSLYLSQPTVTSQVKSLEDDLNAILFVRTKHEVSLTPAGKVLDRYANDVFNLCMEARNEIGALEGELCGMLYAPASLTVGESVLPLMLHAFKAAHPQIELKAEVMNSSKIIELVRLGEREMGLIEVDVDQAGLETEPFMEDELVLFARYDDPIAEKSAISAEEIPQFSLIMREQGSGTRTVFEEGLKTKGIHIEDCHLVLEIGNTEAIKTAVEAGLGVSVLSKNTIRKELESGLFQVISIKELMFTRQLSLVYEKKKSLSAVTMRFMDLIRSRDWSQS
ncbi:selenium metabolism-associated LysR family transcriptional regulator [Salisediminibacterium selenitireducens]|uniref:Transcriptional regulator, LysR family n=1 Tax=Bacillus selenitireducens (strain ATCC 700615 / DSM 15326 / MLS10) TaxID=439292 RepID=D6XZK6_BACIE|nr:selenium metabolism-associated LysR family transcriptional regulator [Salisediminibacterium selenitireducens]ADH98380.1 transcriptional regulator, LysR family [[Bacillus] selenitireducens MLS10]